MANMDRDILDYLKSQRICVVSVEMPDGSPHAATVHYAHTEDPLTLIVKTDRGYRKSQPLLAKESTRASVVVGTDEGNMRTMQMDGVAKILTDEAHRAAYLAKFPEKAAKPDGPDTLYFTFTPTWWRFSDYLADGKKVRTSEE